MAKTSDISAELWAALDSDKKGLLTEDELIENMRSLNPDMDEMKIREVFQKIASSSGDITREDFQKNFSYFWHDDGEPMGASLAPAPSMPFTFQNRESGIGGMGTPQVGTMDGTMDISSNLFSNDTPKKGAVFFKGGGKRMAKDKGTLRPLTDGTTSFPKYTMDQAEDIFAWIDSDGTGVCTLEEMQLALEYYVGSEFKEEQMNRIKELMRMQNLNGIPKEMFVGILKDIIGRLKRSEERRATVESKAKGGLGKAVSFDKRDSFGRESESSDARDEVLAGFSKGLGLSKKSLQDQLAVQMAEKEKLNKRIKELKNAVLNEKKAQKALLSNITHDQETLEKQNKALKEANDRLTQHVDTMADEIDKSKMNVLNLYERITLLETTNKNMAEDYKEAQQELKEVKEEAESLRSENIAMKQQVRGLRTKSIGNANLARERSESQATMANDFSKARKMLEANLNLVHEENKELKEKIAELQREEKEQKRIMMSTQATVEFWKSQVRKEETGEGMDLAQQIAEMAAATHDKKRVGTPPITAQPKSWDKLRTEGKYANLEVLEEENELGGEDSPSEFHIEKETNSNKNLLEGQEQSSNVEMLNVESKGNETLVTGTGKEARSLESHGSLLSKSMDAHQAHQALETENMLHEEKEVSASLRSEIEARTKREKELTAQLKSAQKKLQQYQKRLDDADQQIQAAKEEATRNGGFWCCFN